MTTRDVAELSRKIAAAEGNEEFSVSHARLIQIENDESTPSIYKLFTLSAVYGQLFTDLVSFYIELEAGGKYQFTMQLENTRLANFDTYHETRAVTFPVRFDPGFKVEKTNLVSRMVEIWGEVPVGLLRHLNIRKQRYGFIGLKDYTMYPLLRPGSFVQIDEQQKAPTPHGLPFGVRPTDLVSRTSNRIRMLLVRVAARSNSLDSTPTIALPDPGIRVSE